LKLDALSFKTYAKILYRPLVRGYLTALKEIFSFVEVCCLLRLRSRVLTAQCSRGFGTVIIIKVHSVQNEVHIVPVISAGVDSKAVFGISKIEIDESRTSLIR
jgi:hypothetical protein